MTTTDPNGTEARPDDRRLERTGTPGIFRRTNADGTLGQYVVAYRDGGRQRRAYFDAAEGARSFERRRDFEHDQAGRRAHVAAALRALADRVAAGEDPGLLEALELLATEEGTR